MKPQRAFSSKLCAPIEDPSRVRRSIRCPHVAAIAHLRDARCSRTSPDASRTPLPTHSRARRTCLDPTDTSASDDNRSDAHPRDPRVRGLRSKRMPRHPDNMQSWRTVTTLPLSLYMHAVRSRPHRQLSKGVVLPVRTAIWSRSSLRLPDVLRRRAYSVTRRAGPKRLETRMATPARACPQAVAPLPSQAGSRWFEPGTAHSLC